MQTTKSAGWPRLDALIVTAVAEEHAAVLAVDTGAAPGTAWEDREGVTSRDFEGAGGTLRVGVVQALGMGGAQAAIASAGLLDKLTVRCLAMCGVCAGRRGDVALGDVIFADRVWEYDAGKRKVATVGEERVVEEHADMEMYRLHPPEWKHAAERFVIDAGAAWPELRPRSYEAQGDWILERVLRGADPVSDPESRTRCADFKKALARLWKEGLLKDGTLALTDAGRKRIERTVLENRGALPEAKPLAVHVGPIASGSKVMQDDQVFSRLSESVRKVLGVEMEAAAIGALAWAKGLGYSVVAKGVMDHADLDKSDNFKPFAARASAECLLAFLRENLPPEGRDDEILVPGTSPLPERPGPAALLNARHEVVGFAWREGALHDLRGWCEEEGRVRARLVHAAGGMGKTRLLIELCKRMRAGGWRAGFVPKALGEDRFAALVASERPVLAVMDYAESRGHLRDFLAVAAARRGEPSKKKRLRLVLLARNSDDWWTDLLRSDGPVKDLLSEAPTALETLAGAGVDRAAAFREAAKAFAKVARREVPDRDVPDLRDPRYDRALYVHMAALAAVEGQDVAADMLIGDTLDHEERFWSEQRDRVAVEEMRHAVAALTLTSGVDTAAEARAILGHVSGEPDPRLVLLLHDLYPGAGAQWAGGLEPDLLGEAMVWRVLREERGGAGPYLDRVFEGAGARAVRAGFEVLGRLSEGHEEAEGWIARVLDRDVAGRALEAFAAARAVGERTAHAGLGRVLARALEREGTIEIAKRLEVDLPHPGRTVALREVGRWVLATQLAELGRGNDPERARLLHNLGGYQNALGQREEALASALEAVALHRRLAEARPSAFRQYLAQSLNNLGAWQKALGYREEALASILEAVALHRRLVEERPDTARPGLAMSLNNLGTVEGALGRREEALAAIDDAVALYRRLTEALPDAFLSDLATSLRNLSSALGALGRCEEALAAIHEATEYFRRLAKLRPDAFLPDLALSLHNLRLSRSPRDLREVALASTLEAAREAVDIVWPLFLALPVAFEHHAGACLGELAALERPPSPGLRARIAAFAEKRRAITGERHIASLDDPGRWARIRCPRCAWVPQVADRWECTCGHSWDTFDTRGRCPGCGFQWEETQCLLCCESAPHGDWYESVAPAQPCAR